MSSWEVVGGKSGKKKNLEKPELPKKKKNAAENMPKLKETVPITEDRTIFEAFLEKERKLEEQKGKRGGGGGDTSKSNGHHQTDAKKNKAAQASQAAKKKPEKKKPTTVTFKDVVSQLSVNELRALLDTTRTKFPDLPTIWLKDLVSFLNLKLQAEITDPVFTGEPIGFPGCALTSGIQSLLKNAIRECTQTTLQLFLEHCLTNLVQDANKNLTTFGYRILLQCLAKEKPELIISNLAKFTELRNSTQNRHSVSLSILWAAGQAGLRDLKTGLKVWLELMFPVISIRPFTKYACDYLENIFKQHPGSVSSVSDVLGVREFFPIFDLVHTTPMHTPGQLQVLYPKLRALAYGPNPSSVLRNFFPSYLTRLQSEIPKAMKEELLSSLVECLTQDKHSYSVWRQLYTKHLTQSGILLAHLNKRFDTLPSNFPKKLLQETLSTFRVTNEDHLGTRANSNKQHQLVSDDFAECVKNCNELLAKMSRWRFPWRLVVFFALFTASLFIAYDINQHGSFKASKVGRYLKDYGVLTVWDHAASRVTFYSRKIYKHLEQVVPGYYATACATLGPYLRKFWDFLFLLVVGFWDFVAPLRQWVNVNIPPLLQKLSDNLPKLWSDVVIYLVWIESNLRSFLWTAVAQITYGSKAISHWLQEHIFSGELAPEKILKWTGGLVVGLQEYTSSLYQWLLRSISNML